MKITALLDALNSALAEPFALAWSQDSPRFLLVFTAVYAVAVIVAVTDQKNTRPGAEHGSAAWGDVFRLNKFYMDRHGSNLLLTQHFRIGIDGYKHKHNTNILIVGGSGAGKTRTYGVPNVLECACSMVITDPKSEILRKTGNLLKQKGYEVLVFDLINPAASFCYNPFVYVHDDREVLTLIENLIQNTTPSHSKSSDPFWEKSETALLQALMLYLLHEAPPEEQNFSMVIRSYAGVCLQGVVIALSCIIFSAISSSPPAVDTSASVVTAVWTYVGELAFNLLVLVGAIKGCDRIVKEIMGL